MKKGFTLLEVILSIVMISMFALTFLPMIGWLSVRSTRLVYESQAAGLLQEGIEATYNVFLTDWQTNNALPEGFYHPVAAGGGNNYSWELTPGGESNLETRFSWRIELANVCRDKQTGADGVTACPAGKPIDPNSKLVTGTVQWVEGNSLQKIESTLLLVNMSK